MVTSFLLYLLKNQLIDGAIVTRMSQSDPLRAEPFIARTPLEIISAQKSKYCPVPLGLILNKIKEQSERFAVVGLPCQLNGIRKAQQHDEKLKNNIKFLIGLFCSRTSSFNATLHLLNRKRIDPKEVSFIDYRGEGHPGIMKIGLVNGKVVKIPHLDFDYWGCIFYRFFIPTRCYLCFDKLAYSADIAMGDNWSDILRNPAGSSTIVIREPVCESIINQMQDDKLITAKKIEIEIVIQCQNLINKCNILPRTRLWTLLGGALPDSITSPQPPGNPSFIDTMQTVPQFLRFYMTRNKPNSQLLLGVATVTWLIDRTAQLFYRSLGIFKKSLTFLNRVCLSLAPGKSRPLAKSKKYKIVMIGGYGTRDIGDEAMPHADRLNLRNLLDGDVQIVMLSPNPDYTREFHGEDSIRDILEMGPTSGGGWRSKITYVRACLNGLIFILGAHLHKHGTYIRLWPGAREALDEIASCDLLFNVGGGNLNSITVGELFKKGFYYLAACLLDKPIVVSGQTIGPFENKVDAFFARFCLNKVNVISFRDHGISYQRLQEIGVVNPVMKNAADDAMTIPTISANEANEIVKTEFGTKWMQKRASLKVAMNLKGSLTIYQKRGKVLSLQNEVDLMAQIADALVEKYQAKIVFIPTDYCIDVDDRELHRNIISKMRHQEAAKAIEGEYDDSTLKGLIGLFDVAIGARYHFNVFAASMNVPFLGIASGIFQQTKLKGLAGLYQVEECFVQDDMSKATFAEIWPKVETFINKREYLKTKITEMTPILMERSFYGVKEAVKLIKAKKQDGVTGASIING